MKTYAKGARTERELLHFLNHIGCAVLRVPSSGGFLSPVDIVAIKNGKILAFECKAWSKKPKLKKQQLRAFSEWCRKAGAMGFVAWRRTHSEEKLTASGRWLFLRVEDAEQNKYKDEYWIERDILLRILGL